jgi:hypothetical protein
MLALAVFVAMPFLGFYFGVRYGEMKHRGATFQLQQDQNILSAPRYRQAPVNIPASSSPDEVVSSSVDTSNVSTTLNTDGWKTYRNDEYGYQMKYPSNWILKTGTSASVYGDHAVAITDPSIAERQSKMIVNTSLFANVVVDYLPSISDLYGGLGGAQPKTLEELSTTAFTYPRKIIFAGSEAYEGMWPGDASAYAVLISKNGHIYRVLAIGSGRGSYSDLTTTEKTIFASFEFIQ